MCVCASGSAVHTVSHAIPRKMPPKPLTPQMQSEVNAIVFRPIRSPQAGAPIPARALPQADSSNFMQYVHKQRGFEARGEDSRDNFSGMEIRGDVESSTSNQFDSVYSDRFANKDTEDHFGAGMVMSSASELATRLDEGKERGTSEMINDRKTTFDIVYSSAHNGMDTADHFGRDGGYSMAGDEAALKQERILEQKRKRYEEAKAAYYANQTVEQSHMGHEQGDSASHFAQPGSMLMADDVDTTSAFERVYGSQHVEKDTMSQFKGMRLSAGADSGNVFDATYSARYEGVDNESHFILGSMNTANEQSTTIGTTKGRYKALSKAELYPPPRPKWLHYPQMKAAPPVAAAPVPALSAPMQAHVDEIVTKGGGGASGFLEPGSFSKEAVTDRMLRIEELPASQKRFAWNSDRIAHELVCKFDKHTRRREDHISKLLWTFGSDPAFESANKNAIHVSPKNFHRVCDRFGLVCNEARAEEIFRAHNMPVQGCNLYTLAKNFLDVQDDGLVRKQSRLSKAVLAPVQAARQHSLQAQQPGASADPWRLARLSETAWKAHAATNAQRAQTAPALPPIG